jgi:1-acyl-sn-glycerol-3-phosphate acyltransferase
MNYELKNHTFIIIYDKSNNPVAVNVSFIWNYENYKIMHLGLYLVSKSEQKQGHQTSLGTIQILSAMIENNFNIYFTDISRSATGFKAIDNNPILYCYPSIKFKEVEEDQDFVKISKNIAYAFFHTSGDLCCISTLASYDYKNMVVKDSNKQEGGGLFILTEHIETRKSKNVEYNEFVEKKCPSILDEFIIVFKPSFKKIFFPFLNLIKKIIFSFFLYFRLFLFVKIVLFIIFQFILLPNFINKIIYVFLIKLCIITLGLKINIHGDKKLLNNNKILIFSNHYNGIDFIALTNLFYNYNKSGTTLYTIAKYDLVGNEIDKNILSVLFNYIKKSFFNSLNLLPYKRGDTEDGKKVKNIIVNKLNENDNILIFPEGTSRKDGIPKDFKIGIFQTAIDNNLQILPVTLKYNKNIGLEKNDPLILFDWFDVDVDIYIHDKINSSTYESLQNDPIKLKDKVLKIIINK